MAEAINKIVDFLLNSSIVTTISDEEKKITKASNELEENEKVKYTNRRNNLSFVG